MKCLNKVQNVTLYRNELITYEVSIITLLRYNIYNHALYVSPIMKQDENQDNSVEYSTDDAIKPCTISSFRIHIISLLTTTVKTKIKSQRICINGTVFFLYFSFLKSHGNPPRSKFAGLLHSIALLPATN